MNTHPTDSRGGLNVNSIVVQEMLKNTDLGARLGRIPLINGPAPTIEEYDIPIYPQQQQQVPEQYGGNSMYPPYQQYPPPNQIYQPQQPVYPQQGPYPGQQYNMQQPMYQQQAPQYAPNPMYQSQQIQQQMQQQIQQQMQQQQMQQQMQQLLLNQPMQPQYVPDPKYLPPQYVPRTTYHQQHYNPRSMWQPPEPPPTHQHSVPTQPEMLYGQPLQSPMYQHPIQEPDISAYQLAMQTSPPRYIEFTGALAPKTPKPQGGGLLPGTQQPKREFSPQAVYASPEAFNNNLGPATLTSTPTAGPINPVMEDGTPVYGTKFGQAEWLPQGPFPDQFGYKPYAGVVYSNVEGYMYPGIQENHYNPLPNYDEIVGFINWKLGGGSNSNSNPYMPRGVVGVADINRDKAAEMARHNYALEFGFRSAQDMEENDFNVLKCVSVCAAKAQGLTDDEVLRRIDKVYDEPRRIMEKTRKLNPFGLEGFEEPKTVYNTPGCNIKVVKGDKVLFEVKGEDVPKIMSRKNLARGSEILEGIYKSEMNRLERDYYIGRMWESAIERQFDSFDIIEFFNKAYPEIYYHDLAILQRQQEQARIGKIYDRSRFKRNIMAMYGRPAVKAALQTTDRRYRKNDPLPDGVIRGGYGHYPLGIKMKPTSDPNMGYCFTVDTNTGQPGMVMPRMDEELDRDRYNFMRMSRTPRGGFLNQPKRKEDP